MEVVEKLEKEVKSIKAELFKLCWYMRGGVSIEDLFIMSAEDRTIIAELVSENLETTKKTQLPFF